MDDKATKVIDKSTDDFTTQDHASSIIIHSTGTADQVSRNDSTLLKKLLFKLKGDIYATDDPRQYSPARKKFIVFIVALGGIYGPLSTLIYLPGILQMARDLNASIEAINATMSAYVALAGLTVSSVVISFWNLKLTGCSPCSGQALVIPTEGDQCI